MKTYLYLRVSTDGQEFERQLNLMKENGYDETNSIILEEKLSGKTKKRPVLTEMLKIVDKGDTVVVTDLTRLARSVRDLWEITDTLTSKGAIFVSLKERIDLGTSTGKLLFTVIGAVGQFERDVISERTKEGLRAKVKNGVILGRPIIQDNLEISIQKVLSGYSVKEVSQRYGIKASTLYHHLRKIK